MKKEDSSDDIEETDKNGCTLEGESKLPPLLYLHCYLNHVDRIEMNEVETF